MGHTLALNADGTPLGSLPLTVLNWHDAIKALYLGTVRVVEPYENWIVHSPSQTIHVPAIVMSRTYIKVRRTVAFTKDLLFLRDGYTCQYCGSRFSPGRLTMDHVVPKSLGGGKSFGNMVAACQPCNGRRGNNTKVQPKTAPYRPTYYELVQKRQMLPITIPHASWLPYIGWPEELVTVVQPSEMPTLIPDSEPDRIVRNLLGDD